MKTNNMKKKSTKDIIVRAFVILLLVGTFMVMCGCGGDTPELTEADATNIALEHAGVNEADASRLKTIKDKDDGFVQYEIEFVYDGFEYEYTIDADTGDILEASKEKTVF